MLSWTRVYKYPIETLLSVFLGIYSEVLDLMVILSLIFWETIILFSTAITPFSASKQCIRIPFFLSLYQHLLSVVFFFNSSHPNGYKVVSHGGFDLYFFSDYGHWASFHVLTSHLHICFGVHLIHIFKEWIFEPGSFCRLVASDPGSCSKQHNREEWVLVQPLFGTWSICSTISPGCLFNWWHFLLFPH